MANIEIETSKNSTTHWNLMAYFHLNITLKISEINNSSKRGIGLKFKRVAIMIT